MFKSLLQKKLKQNEQSTENPTCPSCGEKSVQRKDDGLTFCSACGFVVQEAERAEEVADDPDYQIPKAVGGGGRFQVRVVKKKLTAEELVAQKMGLDKVTIESVKKIVRLRHQEDEDVERDWFTPRHPHKKANISEYVKKKLVNDIEAKRMKDFSDVTKLHVDNQAIKSATIDNVKVPIERTDFAGAVPFKHVKYKGAVVATKLAFGVYFHEVVAKFRALFEIPTQGKFTATAYELYSYYIQNASKDFFPSENIRFNSRNPSLHLYKIRMKLGDMRWCSPSPIAMLFICALSCELINEPVFSIEICRAVETGLLPAAQLEFTRVHPEIARRLSDESMSVVREVRALGWRIFEFGLDKFSQYLKVSRQTRIPPLGPPTQRYIRMLNMFSIKDILPTVGIIFGFLHRFPDELAYFFCSEKWNPNIDGANTKFFPQLNIIAVLFFAIAVLDKDRTEEDRLRWKGPRGVLGMTAKCRLTNASLQQLADPDNRDSLSQYLTGFHELFTRKHPFLEKLYEEERYQSPRTAFERVQRKEKLREKVKAFPPWQSGLAVTLDDELELPSDLKEKKYVVLNGRRVDPKTAFGFEKAQQAVTEPPWKQDERLHLVEPSRLDWLSLIADGNSLVFDKDRATATTQVLRLREYLEKFDMLRKLRKEIEEGKRGPYGYKRDIRWNDVANKLPKNTTLGMSENFVEPTTESEKKIFEKTVVVNRPNYYRFLVENFAPLPAKRDFKIVDPAIEAAKVFHESYPIKTVKRKFEIVDESVLEGADFEADARNFKRRFRETARRVLSLVNQLQKRPLLVRSLYNDELAERVDNKNWENPIENEEDRPLLGFLKDLHVVFDISLGTSKTLLEMIGRLAQIMRDIPSSRESVFKTGANILISDFFSRSTHNEFNRAKRRRRR